MGSNESVSGIIVSGMIPTEARHAGTCLYFSSIDRYVPRRLCFSLRFNLPALTLLYCRQQILSPPLYKLFPSRAFVDAFDSSVGAVTAPMPLGAVFPVHCRVDGPLDKYLPGGRTKKPETWRRAGHGKCGPSLQIFCSTTCLDLCFPEDLAGDGVLDPAVGCLRCISGSHRSGSGMARADPDVPLSSPLSQPYPAVHDLKASSL